MKFALKAFASSATPFVAHSNRFTSPATSPKTAPMAYYETATLSDVTDPNIIFELRAKLDGAGFYDDADVERVVRVEHDPNARQSDLSAALEPVVSRLLTRYKEERERKKRAEAHGDERTAGEATDELAALDLFKTNIASYLRAYAFLSQIIDYGTTAVEKRFLFFKKVLPLLAFGRERDGIDLSAVRLTHHALKRQKTPGLVLGGGEAPTLTPLHDVGGGSVHEQEKALLAEILAAVNDLFEGDLTDGDQVTYVYHTIGDKLLESATLVQQAHSNSKEQFANSPDLAEELEGAIMDALEAHTVMSGQALNSSTIRLRIRELLLGPARLYERLCERSPAP